MSFFIKNLDPDTEREIVAVYKNGVSTRALADMYGCGRQTIWKILKRNNVVFRPNWERAAFQPGESHRGWKGGRSLTGDGYIRVHVDHDDPLFSMVRPSDKHYALEHRLVMARYLGRPLKKSESVHHINGDRTDNRIENLQLRQGSHGAGQVWACNSCGSRDVIAEDL